LCRRRESAKSTHPPQVRTGRVSGPWRAELFGLSPGALNSGIFYFLTLGNNILADRLDGRFVPQ
jgi:hypothetical protein